MISMKIRGAAFIGAYPRRRTGVRFAWICASLALACLAILAGLQAAAAQSDVSARIEWYGVHDVKSVEVIDDPASPTERRVTLTPIAPKSNTDRIPGRQGIRFGFSYVLTGKNRGQEVIIRRVYRFPGDGMPNSRTGTKVENYSDVETRRVGESVFMGWSFKDAPPDRIITGDWVLEVWTGDRKLVEKRFTVYAP